MSLYAIYLHDIRFALATAALGIALIKLIRMELERDAWFVLCRDWRKCYEEMKEVAHGALAIQEKK